MSSQSDWSSGSSDDNRPPSSSSDDGQPIDPDATLIRGPLPPEPTETSPTSRRAGVLAALVGGALIVLVGAVYLVGYLMAGDKLPKDAEIAGIAVGGLSTEAAVEKLQAELGERAAAPIAVTAGDEKAEVSPSDAGLSVDYAASVELAGGGRSLDPRHIWRVLTGGSQTDAVVVTDRAAADRGRRRPGEGRRPGAQGREALLRRRSRSCRPGARTGSSWTPSRRRRPSRAPSSGRVTRWSCRPR